MSGPDYQKNYPPAGQPPVVVTTQPVVAPAVILFRDIPVPMKCTYCQADIMTSTEFESGTLTWIICGVICFIGCFFPLVWLGCCFIPFCISSCKDCVHKCPNCGQMVGRFNRMS